MTNIPGGKYLQPHQKESPQLRVIKWLLRAKATGIKNPHFWIILGLMAGLGYLYYGVLTAFHDVYVILFFYPLIYAAIVFRLRGVMISWVVFLGILLLHAMLFSTDPYSLARSLLFAAFAFLISSLIATQLNYLERQLEAYREILSLNEELNNYAIQAMPDGGKLTIRTSLGDGGYIQVSVQDTGCGIPPENLDKLFTPFFTTKEEVKGVGLGLAVSYGIIERHGGRIEVQSEVGQGSTFTVHLPASGGERNQPTSPHQ